MQPVTKQVARHIRQWCRRDPRDPHSGRHSAAVAICVPSGRPTLHILVNIGTRKSVMHLPRANFSVVVACNKPSIWYQVDGHVCLMYCSIESAWESSPQFTTTMDLNDLVGGRRLCVSSGRRWSNNGQFLRMSCFPR